MRRRAHTDELLGLGDAVWLQLPGMYAVTDGRSTQYHIFYKMQRMEIAYNHWPFPIEPTYGVAAVKYGQLPEMDDAGVMSTGMLGCECLAQQYC